VAAFVVWLAGYLVTQNMLKSIPRGWVARAERLNQVATVEVTFNVITAVIVITAVAALVRYWRRKTR